MSLAPAKSDGLLDEAKRHHEVAEGEAQQRIDNSVNQFRENQQYKWTSLQEHIGTIKDRLSQAKTVAEWNVSIHALNELQRQAASETSNDARMAAAGVPSEQRKAVLEAGKAQNATLQSLVDLIKSGALMPDETGAGASEPQPEGASPKPGGAAPSPAAGGVPQGAIDKLKGHPELAKQFDDKYGQGASRKYLGQQ